MKNKQASKLPEYFYQTATLPRRPNEDKDFFTDFSKEREIFEKMRGEYCLPEGQESWLLCVGLAVKWTSKILYAVNHRTVQLEELETHPLVRARGFVLAMLDDPEAHTHMSIGSPLDRIFPEATWQGLQDWAAFKSRPGLKLDLSLKVPAVN